MVIIIIYLVGINILGYLSMGIDKKKAIKGEYRISEKNLFAIAILGGSLGSMIGMKRFRHKTKHWYFKYGMPAILIVQLIVVMFLLGEKDLNSIVNTFNTILSEIEFY